MRAPRERPPAGPTSTMRSPSTRTIAGASGGPPRPSIRRAARSTIVPAAASAAAAPQRDRDERDQGPPGAFHVPSNSSSTSPTWRTLPPSGQAMSSGPPSHTTRTRRSQSPFIIDATAAEAAPVPEARV